APGIGKRLDGLLVNYIADLGLGGFNQRRLAGDRDHLVGRADLEVEVHFRGAAHAKHHSVFDFRAEAGALGPKLITSRLDAGETVVAIRIAGRRPDSSLD